MRKKGRKEEERKVGYMEEKGKRRRMGNVRKKWGGIRKEGRMRWRRGGYVGKEDRKYEEGRK